MSCNPILFFSWPVMSSALQPEVVCSDIPSSGREPLVSVVLCSLFRMEAFDGSNYLLKGDVVRLLNWRHLISNTSYAKH